MRKLVAFWITLAGVGAACGTFLSGGIGGRIGSGVIAVLLLWFASLVWRGPRTPKPDEARMWPDRPWQ
ncbi:hypothetical protein ACFY1J_30980 [Streptomyces sp. NPDC001406]|uniref:hypothetical protein n=1 Tax=Streptomyces sp. NPDC001406 TaxID=3364572 RepID=UPI0036AE536A